MQKSARKYKGNTKIHKIFNVHISNRIFIPLVFFCNCVHKNLNLRKHPQFDHCRNIFTKIKNRMIYKKKKKKITVITTKDKYSRIRCRFLSRKLSLIHTDKVDRYHRLPSPRRKKELCIYLSVIFTRE